jgi:hypothetical protein
VSGSAELPWYRRYFVKRGARRCVHVLKRLDIMGILRSERQVGRCNRAKRAGVMSTIGKAMGGGLVSTEQASTVEEIWLCLSPAPYSDTARHHVTEDFRCCRFWI